jgi:hypothetical protein
LIIVRVFSEKRYGDSSHRSKRAEEQELEEVMREIQQSFPPEGNKSKETTSHYLAIIFKLQTNLQTYI